MKSATEFHNETKPAKIELLPKALEAYKSAGARREFPPQKASELAFLAYLRMTPMAKALAEPSLLEAAENLPVSPGFSQ